MPDINLNFFRWLYVAIISPVLGWLGGVFGAAWKNRRRNKAIVERLRGLPPECKAVLVDFYQQGSHTLREDPMSPPVRVLINQGILVRGPGGGTYDAIDRYLSIVPHIWKVMDKWVVTDDFVIRELTDNSPEKTNDHAHE